MGWCASLGCQTMSATHLVTEHGAQVPVDVHPSQRSLPAGVKLTEPVQRHHGLQSEQRVQMRVAAARDIHSVTGLMDKETQGGLVDKTKPERGGVMGTGEG